MFLITILSALFGGLLVLLVTYVSDKYGGNIGGIVATIPSGTLIASIGLALSSDSSKDVQESLYSAPIGGFINNIYIILWVYIPLYLPKVTHLYRFLILLCISFSFWLISSLIFVLILYPMVNEDQQLSLAILFLFLSYYIASLQKLSWNNVSKPKPKMPLTLSRGILRFSIGFIFIFTIIMMTQVNETLAAVLSVFPALGSANQFILWFSSDDGEDVVRSLSSSMAIGNTGVYSYILLFAIFLPKFGLILSVVLSFILSTVCISVPLYFILRTSKNNYILKDIDNNINTSNDIKMSSTNNLNV